MRKSWAVAATAALIATASTISAPSASAAVPTYSVNGCSDGAIVYRIPNGVPVRVDTSTCTYRDWYSDGGSIVAVDPASPAAYVDVTLGSGSVYVDVVAGRVDIVIYSCAASAANGSRPADYEDVGDYWDGIFANNVIDHCDWPAPSSASDGDAPPSWFQAYGRKSAAEACDAGWSPSWAAWPNNGTGGPVCEREIYWNRASGTWLTR